MGLPRHTPQMTQRYLMKGYWKATSIADIRGLHAKVHPDKEALVVGNTRMTYAECEGWMDRVALGLHELGIKPDDVVFRQLPNSAEAILALLGCEKAGTIACSRVTQLRHQEAEHVLQKTETVAGKVKIDGDSNLAQMLLDRLVSKIGGRE